MKNVLVLFLVLGFLLVGIGTAVAGPPQDVTIPVMQQQTRYYPDGSEWFSLAAFETSFELRLTGNALHGEMEYSPMVTDKRAYRFVLVNRGNDRWELRMGSTHYTSPVSGYTIDEYWEGYLILDGNFNLVEGEFKQIGYCSADPRDAYPWAEKGHAPKRGLWCLGWGIYTYTAP